MVEIKMDPDELGEKLEIEMTAAGIPHDPVIVIEGRIMTAFPPQYRETVAQMFESILELHNRVLH